ncbi:Crp/Fnr family transcriptional regulator [Chitinophaga eiseniae]|uniref:Crp/Fnr family transcriptional regulator n=1 Tax=Chitinophaga eiseniae TaxID=634771 RepID=A0A847SL66_9BACT|nr:Crp/Fnr family transcriptional regulator [Chitinophaga eiseniae]NLR79527.1 Crp/Fnr family transcriptional regulator [Chitinophaga eiseniae]
MKHEQLIRFVERNVPVDRFDIDLIENYFEPVAVNKNVVLEREDKIANHLYFVNSGFVRVYHLENGEEITTHINCQLNFITSFNSFITATPAQDNVESITPCELLRISKKHLDALYQQSEKWTKFCKKIYEQSLTFNEQRMKDILTLPAEKRYLKLIATQPEVIRNVPLQYIASYIGIKPASLSRIRRQVIS